MAGVGKLLKQAQKMQRQIEQVQSSLAEKKIEVSSGGGAVRVAVNGAGEFLELHLDPEFLEEEASLVSDTILEAVKEAAAKAKAFNDEEMRRATSGFSMPGMF